MAEDKNSERYERLINVSEDCGLYYVVEARGKFDRALGGYSDGRLTMLSPNTGVMSEDNLSVGGAE